MLIGMGKRERVGGGQRSRTHWLVSRWLARWPRPLQASGPHTGNGPRSGCWGQWWRGSHGWWGCPGCHLSRSAPSRSGARWWSSRGAPPRSPGSRFLRASGQWKKAGQWPEEPHLEEEQGCRDELTPPKKPTARCAQKHSTQATFQSWAIQRGWILLWRNCWP